MPLNQSNKLMSNIRNNLLKDFTIIFTRGTLVLSVDKKWDRLKGASINFDTGLNFYLDYKN